MAIDSVFNTQALAALLLARAKAGTTIYTTSDAASLTAAWNFIFTTMGTYIPDGDKAKFFEILTRGCNCYLQGNVAP